MCVAYRISDTRVGRVKINIDSVGWVKLGMQLMGRVGLKRLIRIDFVLYIMPAIHGSDFAGSEFFCFLVGSVRSEN